MKSVVARLDLPAATVITEEHLAFKKPGDGLRPEDAGRLVGRTLKVPLCRDDPVRLEDTEVP
jgi:sialic acid synthase SpsE